ncbi:AEL_collapsed_G0016240.mRNA.1.CDS.1 [Saccharomyces cerevisiae]|nr:AEL_collapsed_G0016240.mRNA.1.CDS.1 [Saccharomyces cerevisiae]
MNVPTAPTPNKHLNIPDLRFEKVFKKALHRELAPSSSPLTEGGCDYESCGSRCPAHALIAELCFVTRAHGCEGMVVLHTLERTNPR